jgi:hypothetical protein
VTKSFGQTSRTASSARRSFLGIGIGVDERDGDGLRALGSSDFATARTSSG